MNRARIRRWYREALTIRRFEEGLIDLFRNGWITGTMHLSIGQEIAPVILADHLNERDVVCASHRGHAALLALTQAYQELLRELLGLDGLVTQGKGGSQHLCVPGRYYSNGILGGMVPVAAGIAQGFKHQASGNIAVVFLGDGALGQGVVYETFNLASLLELQLLFLVEDNGVSQSTPITQHLSGSIFARFAAFGIPVQEVRHDEFEHLDDSLAAAVASLRRGRGPHAIIVQTKRLCGHSVNSIDSAPRDLSDDPLLALEKLLCWRDVDDCRQAAAERVKAYFSSVGPHLETGKK